MSATHTPGPWRWEFNADHRALHLVGGRPMFDLTILQPCRWGMSGATLMIRDTAHDGLNLLHKLHERPDWIAPIPGREHHANWIASVTHPDMRLIEAAPLLLHALERLVSCADKEPDSKIGHLIEHLPFARAAIHAATGRE